MGEVLPYRPRPGSLWATTLRLLWNASLNRLTDYLTIMQEETKMDDLKITAPDGEPVLFFTRTLKAPRALVWKALSEPEHVVRWWGPHDHKNRVVTFDFRVGGKWEIEPTTGEGQKILFFGEYREIATPEKVTQTFSFDHLPPDMFSLDTVVLEDQGDKTIYRGYSTLPDVAARDAMVASGMEYGMREGFERLDQMLEDWKALA